MTTRAKLFINGRSQAVRIPRNLEFRGVDAVYVEKRGSAIILTPVRKTWDSFGEGGSAKDDFMRFRPRLLKSQRS